MANTVNILYSFSDHYFHAGDYHQSIRLDHLVEKMDPHYEEAYSVAAWLEWSDGDTPAAIEDLHRSVRANPNDPVGYTDLADCYWLWLKQPENAIPYYLNAGRFYNDVQQVAYHSLAHCLEKVGDYNRSAVAWRMALLKAAGDPGMQSTVKRNLARVLEKKRIQEKGQF